MKKLLSPQFLHDLFVDGLDYLQGQVLVFDNLQQLVGIVVALMVARLVAPRLERRHRLWCQQRGRELAEGSLWRLVNELILPSTWLAVLWLFVTIARAADLANHFMTIVMSLLAAWLVIRPAGVLFRNQLLAKGIAVVAWLIAALNILNLLDKTTRLLAGITFRIGKLTLSLLAVIQGVLLFAILAWLGTLLAAFCERRLQENTSLSPSVKVLTIKLIKILLILIAVLLSLSAVGIDLTVFAVFGGALGVGIGFGLQKSVANFTSGILLLLDKSIKPGDVISVGDTFGWVKSLNARYVSLETRGGIEHLIPNEDLIVQRVENWSFSHNLVRLKLPVSVHYRSDLRQAIQLCVAAAAQTPRVMAEPPPICLLTGFGDSAVALEVRLWIDDPQNGISNVKSEVWLRIWDLFRDHGIEIPYPQRDVHIKTREGS